MKDKIKMIGWFFPFILYSITVLILWCIGEPNTILDQTLAPAFQTFWYVFGYATFFFGMIIAGTPFLVHDDTDEPSIKNFAFFAVPGIAITLWGVKIIADVFGGRTYISDSDFIFAFVALAVAIVCLVVYIISYGHLRWYSLILLPGVACGVACLFFDGTQTLYSCLCFGVSVLALTTNITIQTIRA